MERSICNGTAMTKGPISRLSIAVILGFVVVLAQVGAFAAIGFSAWHEMATPSISPMRFPFVHLAGVIRGELVYPVVGFATRAGGIRTGEMIFLRVVDLQTGKARDIPTPHATAPIGTVTDGKRLWCLGVDEIHELDGTTVVSRPLKGSPTGMTRISDPFLYEGCLALIDQDSEGHYRLRVLVDDTWQEKAQIVLPGGDRAWAVDDQTGESRLVPRTASNSIGTSSSWLRLQVIPANGKYQLFQSDYQGAVAPARTLIVCQRIGFDYVSKPAEDKPVSALLPENALADTTGWVLLDAKVLNDAFQSPVSTVDGLLFPGKRDVWRQSLSARPTPSNELECVGNVDDFRFGNITLVSSADSRQAYVIANPRNDDMELYCWDEGRFHKLPIRLEGMSVPAQRWVAKLALQGLAVVIVGTLLLVLLAADWAGKSSYSFGHDSVALASLIRRSLARGVDFMLIGGPLVLQSAWLFQIQFNALFIQVLEMEDRYSLLPLLPAAIWLGLTWIAFVVSTGTYGVTPGKWLCGLRVVRTTLRPCGILRALLRELLLCVDAPQMLTAIPGVLCLVATQNRQRIGDLIAGTLVTQAAKKCRV